MTKTVTPISDEPKVLWLSSETSDGHREVWFDPDEGGTMYVRADLASPSPETQMMVVDPNQWEPCSPLWLKRGGDCACAPRVWNDADRNHWHPKIVRGSGDFSWLSELTLEQIEVVVSTLSVEKQATLRSFISGGGTVGKLETTSRKALQSALVAMKLASALPGVSREYDFSSAIAEVEASLACNATGVKPLVWEALNGLWIAATPFGLYRIQTNTMTDERFSMDPPGQDHTANYGKDEYVHNTLNAAKKAAQSDCQKRVEAMMPYPSAQPSMRALDTWTVARHMKDFGAFVSEVAPKLHWKIYQDLGSDMSRYSGYFDGWQCGFGEKVFEPLPLPDLIKKMKAAVSAALGTTEGSDV